MSRAEKMLQLIQRSRLCGSHARGYVTDKSNAASNRNILNFPSGGWEWAGKTVTIALPKTNTGVCHGWIPGYSASELAPVSSEWCVGAVGPANLPWLLLLGWLLCLWHMAEEALAGL